MLSPTLTSITVLMLLPSAAARASSNDAEAILSSFVFVLHGERTPPQPYTERSLTSLGAQQLYSQGGFLRSRYLSDSAGNSTSSHPIVGMSRDAPLNSQLSISSVATAWTFGSALAFTQGLYPPVTQTSSQGNAGADNSSYLADGTFVDFPLGYQVPEIETLSALDPKSIWLQGDVSCPNWMVAASSSGDNDPMYNRTQSMYQDIFTDVFPDSFPAAMLNYNFAIDLYEYAAYQHTHNATARAALSDAELELLRLLADMQQFDMNSNLSGTSSLSDQQISAIAGRTLAAQIVSRFMSVAQSSGDSDKLTLVFGSFQPFLALFALLGLSGSQPDRLFERIPDAGAVMVFELFTLNELSDGSTPGPDDMRVRFMYRNGTGDHVPLNEYPLFDRKASDAALSFVDFSMAISKFAVKDLAEWCGICSAVTLFCSGIQALGSSDTGSTNSGSSGGMINSRLSPTAAGLVGAGCGIAVMLLAGAAAAVLGGYRVRRNVESGIKASEGFKGGARLADDQDVALAKNGAAHARVGSWELGKGSAAGTVMVRPDETISPVTQGNGQGSRADDVFGASFVRRRDGNEDGESVMGVQPVQPTEGI